jgi:polar amino acid transport system substrate-binding protein
MRYAAIPVLLGALAAAPAAAQPAPQPVTIYVDDAYPPYSYAVNGAASGVYPAVLARIFAGMPGYKVELQPVPWKRGLRLLEQGEGFALAPPYYRPAERPWMDYSAPIVLESVVVYCNEAVAARTAEPRWPDDYHGLRIGVNMGFLLGGAAFDTARRGGRLTVEEARGTDENLKKLLLGRIDCYMNDRAAIQHALQRARAEDAYQRMAHIVETNVVSQENGYLGFTRLHGERWPFRADFIRQFNLVLETLRRSGELGQIAERELHR